MTWSFSFVPFFPTFKKLVELTLRYLNGQYFVNGFVYQSLSLLYGVGKHFHLYFIATVRTLVITAGYAVAASRTNHVELSRFLQYSCQCFCSPRLHHKRQISIMVTSALICESFHLQSKSNISRITSSLVKTKPPDAVPVSAAVLFVDPKTS